MNIRNTLLLAAILLGVAASITQAADDSSQKKTRVKGPRPEEDTSTVKAVRAADKVVVFKQTPQGELKAHIYFPPGWSASDQRPAIVFWVGGGFRSGKVGQFMSKAEYFAARGLVTICAEYRGRQTHKILQPWHDATTRKADEFLVSLGYLEGPPTIKENPAAMLILAEKE